MEELMQFHGSLVRNLCKSADALGPKDRIYFSAWSKEQYGAWELTRWGIKVLETIPQNLKRGAMLAAPVDALLELVNGNPICWSDIELAGNPTVLRNWCDTVASAPA